jgi:hypothetical protein
MDALTGAYLPIITTESWRQTLNGWQEGEPLQDSEWFTLFIADMTGQQGITVPQSTESSDLVAAWSGNPHKADLVVFEPKQSLLLHFAVNHCAPPSWNTCGSGRCGNPCQLTTLSDVKWGEVKTCRCPHNR